MHLRQVKVSRNYQFPKEYADSHTPAPIVQRKGESDSTDSLHLNINYDSSEGQPTTSTLKRKHEAEPPRRSTQPKVTHDYSKLNDPLLDLEDILDDDDDEDERMSSAEAAYQAFTKTNLRRGDPKSLKEAKESPKWPNWEKAVQAELDQLHDMGTWKLVDPPENRTPMTNKWIFVKKLGKDGELLKYKARFVARGFSQQPGMDYNETFSLVVQLKMI